MKKLVILFIGICAVSLSGCNKKSVVGNGKVIFQNRDLKDYSSLSVNGAYTVYVKKGSVSSFVIEADENLLPFIKTEISGNNLKVYNSKNILRSKELKLIITNPQLNSCDFSGAIELNSDSGLIYKILNITISGIGRIDMNLNTDSLLANVSGGAELTFSGNAKKFDGIIKGTGSIDAVNFIVQESNIEISGLGKAKLNVIKKLNVNITGFGKVDYKGEPQINQVISGAGKVNKIN